MAWPWDSLSPQPPKVLCSDSPSSSEGQTLTQTLDLPLPASAGSRRAFEFLNFLLFLSSHGLLSLLAAAADGSEPLGNHQDLMAGVHLLPGF